MTLSKTTISKTWTRRGAGVLAGALIAALGFSPVATAQTEFPSGVVKLIVGFPAGGGTDIMARQLAQRLEKKWGKPVIVENRVGAGGVVAAEFVSRAPADGHVLMLGHIQTVVLAPLTMVNSGVAEASNFAPISLVARQPHIVAIRKESEFKTVADLLSAAKSRGPGQKLKYGSTGVGSVQHLAAAKFASDAGIDMLHVPYKGSTPALQALISGEIDVLFDGITPATPFLKSGAIRSLAVTTAEPVASLDMRPLTELGFPGYEMTSWWALMGPKSLPAERRAFIAKAVQDSIQEPDFVDYLATMGVVSGKGVVGARFDAFVQDESKKYSTLTSALGVKP
jgi:tripartite-type tricarboxylate transporter receptor subunit TctC